MEENSEGDHKEADNTQREFRNGQAAPGFSEKESKKKGEEKKKTWLLKKCDRQSK